MIPYGWVKINDMLINTAGIESVTPINGERSNLVFQGRQIAVPFNVDQVGQILHDSAEREGLVFMGPGEAELFQAWKDSLIGEPIPQVVIETAAAEPAQAEQTETTITTTQGTGAPG
jgi:hypothetical protein